MSDSTKQAWWAHLADPKFGLCGKVGDFFVMVAWKEEDADWMCRAHLGDKVALIDLKTGSWEEL